MYPITLLFSPLIVVLLTLLVIIVFRHSRKAVFGAVFFFITILPVLQITPIGWAIAADRYTYVPALGIFYIFGEACSWFYTQKLSGRKHLKTGFFSFFALLLVVLSILSWQRCHIWKDGITFWNDVIIKYPAAALAYNNRGIAYMMKGDGKSAIEDYKTAIRLEPAYLPPLANLLTAYCRSGMSSAAIFLYDVTVRQSPETERRLMDFGRTSLENNDTNNAISLYMTFLRILPEKSQRYLNGEIYHNLALAYHRTKQFELAAYYAKKAKDSGYNISRELQTYMGSGE
jgi:tetratricopeptide (TPR) repeat protein